MKPLRAEQEVEQAVIQEPGLLERLEEFVQTNIKLYQYKAIDKGTEVASSVISVVIMAIFFLLGFVVLSMGLALLIGYWLGSSYWGFFVMGGIYILIGLVFYLFRNSWVKTPLINSLSKKFID
jgi:hypothetical protein